MLILLMPRMLAKCQVLISQLRDKFPPVATIDKTNTTPALQFSTMSRFSAHIHTLQVDQILFFKEVIINILFSRGC